MQKAFQSTLISTFVPQRLDIRSNSSFFLRSQEFTFKIPYKQQAYTRHSNLSNIFVIGGFNDENI